MGAFLRDLPGSGGMTGDICHYENSTATITAASSSCYVITCAPWYPEPLPTPKRRNRVPFYRGLFDQRAPAAVAFSDADARKPKWKPLMGKRQPCRD